MSKPKNGLDMANNLLATVAKAQIAGSEPPTRGIEFSFQPRTKAGIDRQVEEYLTEALEVHSAGEVFVLARQLQTASETMIAKLKEDSLAVDSICRTLGGAMSGEIMGADVRVTYPKRWTYDDDVADEIRKVKGQLKALEITAQTSGKAKQFDGSAVISVILKGGA